MYLVAIVILYDPDSTVLSNIDRMLGQVDEVVVVVNRCENKILSNLRDKGVILIVNHENIGLAMALNLGISKALSNKQCTHVVLFDQDSTPSNDYIFNVQKVFSSLHTKDMMVGAVGGSVTDVKKDKKQLAKNDSYSSVQVLITSGTVIPIKVLEDIGLMDETFFIDYIDYEWCFRAISKGYCILVSNNSILSHNLGNKLVQFGGIEKPIHTNTIRHYYIIRNQLIMLTREYIPITWRIKEFLKLFYRIPGYIYFSYNRKSTLHNIYKAIVDFKENRKVYKTYKY